MNQFWYPAQETEPYSDRKETAEQYRSSRDLTTLDGIQESLTVAFPSKRPEERFGLDLSIDSHFAAARHEVCDAVKRPFETSVRL